MQAINPKLLEKIILGREGTSRQLKMLRRQVQYFLRGLLKRAHVFLNLSFSPKEEKRAHLCVSRRKPAASASRQNLRLRSFFHAEHVAIETTRAVLAAFWHGKLHMVNVENPSRSAHWIFRQIGRAS